MDHHERPPTQRDIAGYTLQTRLGSGSFATVYKAILSGPTHSESDLPSVAAIKSITRSKKLTPKVLANLQTEISILRNHRHPNIVRLFKVSETKECVYLILEYCAGGDLQHLIRTRKRGRLGERLCRRLIRDLACGLGFLWERQLIHRDIKPQNLLLTSGLPKDDEDENPPKEPSVCGDTEDGGEFMLKIADFGFARHLGGVDLAETMCGSPLYMSPEILLGQKYDAKADLWSVGTVLFEMISGRTPFHGENHMDLLNNIKRKAVRLPPDVRVSKECVALLRMLLDRRPSSRADFKMFYEAVEKFVALGCSGPKLLEESLQNVSDDMMPLKAQMDLCAITEDDSGESEEAEKPCALRPLTTINPASTGIPMKQATTQDLVQIVTPPFQPTMAPAPPPNLYAGIQSSAQRQGTRPSVFAPLQASPNLSPASTQVGAFFPTLSLGDGGTSTSNSRLPSVSIQQRAGVNPLLPTEHINNSRRESQHSSTSSREAYDSGFVLVEHSGNRSRPGSLTNSPSNSITRAPPSPSNKYYQDGFSQSPSGSRMILNGAMGMLGTSPATGQALVGRMMMGTPNTKSGMSAAPISSGKFNVSPRSALRSGGCLAHIDILVRMLSAAEDIGRRAISIAHLGDVRAYLAMGAYVAQRDESRSSSSCTPMELEDDGNARLSLRGKLSKKTIVEEEEEDDELPFAMTTSLDDGSADDMSQSPLAGNILSNLAPLIGSSRTNNASDHSSNEEKDFPTLIHVHFHEALLCYIKTLTMLKSAICAAQKVLNEVEEVMRLPSSRNPANANNPYTPLQKRCSGSLAWLGKNHIAIVERADAAGDQISSLEKTSGLQCDVKDSELLVQELIFNHCLKCGQDGTVKQTLGHFNEARSCYRSAGLLAETLLMDPKVGNEDRVVLESYVASFVDRIMEIDGLIQAQNSGPPNANSSSVLGIRRQSSILGNH